VWLSRLRIKGCIIKVRIFRFPQLQSKKITYLAVIMNRMPSHFPSLVAYQCIITSVSVQCPLESWLNYDVQFWRLAASYPSLWWEIRYNSNNPDCPFWSYPSSQVLISNGMIIADSTIPHQQVKSLVTHDQDLHVKETNNTFAITPIVSLCQSLQDLWCQSPVQSLPKYKSPLTSSLDYSHGILCKHSHSNVN